LNAGRRFFSLRGRYEDKLDSVEAVGACLKAGTGCGSCMPEIRRLVARLA
jgi:NAD(P)H-nitrite reductase large subunit